MTTFTTRLGLPRPALSELADGPDAFNDLTDVLDPTAAVFAQGTAATRPAPGLAGRFHWATDTRTLSYDTGTAWTNASGAAAIGSSLPVLDVGMASQIRAGRQLAASDFTAQGLSQPIGLWNLSDLSNLGSDARALANKGAVPFGVGVNGVASTCAVFAGSTSQALYIADSGAADPLRIRTGSWGCWLRTAKRAATQMILAKSGDAAGTLSYALSVTAGNAVYGWVSVDGTALLGATSASDVADDRWHLAVVTFDGAMVRTYVDGVLEAATAFMGAIFAGVAPLNIGGRRADASTAVPAGEAFYGRVDEAFVSADILSEDQIRCLYASALPHTLGVTPTGVRLNVTRRRKGAPLAPADFPTLPLRLHNFTAGALTDQGSGNVALVNAGTAPIPVAGADGAPAGAVSLGATATAHLMATDAGLPAALTARSYGCWFKTTGTATGNIIGWGGTVGTADVRLIVNAGVLYAYNGGDAITGAYATDGQWHFAVVCEDNAAGDGLRRRLYLDGRLVGSSTVLNSITLAGANRFRIGAAPDAGFPLPGQFDGAFVCGYALTFEQVGALYAKASQDLGTSPKEPGTHVERLDTTRVLFVADTLDSQHTVDLSAIV